MSKMLPTMGKPATVSFGYEHAYQVLTLGPRKRFDPISASQGG